LTNPWAQWLSRNDVQRYQLSRKTGWDAFVTAGSREALPALSATELAELGEEERADYDECRMVWNANLPIIKIQQMLRATRHYRGHGLQPPRWGPVARVGGHRRCARTREDHRRAALRPQLPPPRVPPPRPDHRGRASAAAGGVGAVDGGGDAEGAEPEDPCSSTATPDAVRATSTRLGALAEDCVISCQTRIIVIDDLHIIDFKHRAGVEVSNDLKWLANEMPVTFIFTGMQLAEKRSPRQVEEHHGVRGR